MVFRSLFLIRSFAFGALLYCPGVEKQDGRAHFVTLSIQPNYWLSSERDSLVKLSGIV